MEIKSKNNFFNYSTSLPSILHKLNCSIVISTYQAGKVIIVSSLDGQHLRMYAKNFTRPMGLCVSDEKLAVVARHQLHVYASSRKMAYQYPTKPKFHDAVFLPQVTYYTGKADMHEIEWGDEGLWSVNTAFSCLSLMDDANHFKPMWKPPFITKLTPEDKCHINGLAMQNGKPKVVSMLGTTNTKKGWKANMLEGGILMDVTDNTVLAEKLPIPHSPLFDEDGDLTFLLSGTGKIMRRSTSSGEITEIASANAFVRGMDLHQGMLFVGKSSLRKTSTMYDLLSFPKDINPGVGIFDQKTGEEIAQINFLQRITEIFDVKVMPNLIRPIIVDEQDEVATRAFKLPSGSFFWESVEEAESKKV